MKTCPLCGYQNPDSAKECTRCGTELTAVKATTTTPKTAPGKPLKREPLSADPNNPTAYGNEYIMSIIEPRLKRMTEDYQSWEYDLAHVRPCKKSKFRERVGGFFENIIVSFLALIIRLLILLLQFLVIGGIMTYILKYWILPLFSIFPGSKAYVTIIGICGTVLLAVLIVRTLRKFELFGSISDFFDERADRKKDKERYQNRIAEIEQTRVQSLKRIPGFLESYWNKQDLMSIREAFASYQAHTWKEAYQYADKVRKAAEKETKKAEKAAKKEAKKRAKRGY